MISWIIAALIGALHLRHGRVCNRRALGSSRWRWTSASNNAMMSQSMDFWEKYARRSCGSSREISALRKPGSVADAQRCNFGPRQKKEKLICQRRFFRAQGRGTRGRMYSFVVDLLKIFLSRTPFCASPCPACPASQQRQVRMCYKKKSRHAIYMSLATRSLRSL